LGAAISGARLSIKGQYNGGSLVGNQDAMGSDHHRCDGRACRRLGSDAMDRLAASAFICGSVSLVSSLAGHANLSTADPLLMVASL
jgi:hypothetical protein